MLLKGIVKKSKKRVQKTSPRGPICWVVISVLRSLYTSAIRELFQTTSKAGLLSPDSVSIGFSIYFFNVGREDPVII